MNKTMPAKPQRNLIHSTSPQNQCAQHSAGQYASTPTIEQLTGNRSPIQGMDGNTPHRDEGTQMPSQEIHTITINQGTQIPSQQWEQTMTTEDHETLSQNPSPRSGAHQGTLTKQPARPPALDTEITDTIGSHLKSYVHPKPVIIQRNHAPTQMVDMRRKRDDTKTHSVHINKEDQGPEATTPDNKNIPKTPRAHPSDLQVNIGDKREDTTTVKTTHVTTTPPIATIVFPKDNSNDNVEKITARNDRRSKSSETSIMSTGDNSPDSKQTHPNTKERDVIPQIFHSETGNSKQESPTQSTGGHPHQIAVGNTSLDWKEEENPKPDVLTREPKPIQNIPRTTITSNRKMPITKDSTRDASVPAVIAISSSEDGSENDGDQPTAQEDWSKVSIPYQKNKSEVHTPTPAGNYIRKKSRSVITIGKHNRSSHQEITILEDTTQGVPLKEI